VLWRMFGPVIGGRKVGKKQTHTQERHNSYFSKSQVYRGDKIEETRNGYTDTSHGNKVPAENF